MSDVIYFCIWKTFLANLENNGFWNVENKNCQIAAWTAWLEAYYMSSDETPTFVNCQLKYILINDN